MSPESGVRAEQRLCAGLEGEYAGFACWVTMDGRWVARKTGAYPMVWLSAGSYEGLRDLLAAAVLEAGALAAEAGHPGLHCGR